MTAVALLRRAPSILRRGLWVVLLLGAVLGVAWFRLWSSLAAEVVHVGLLVTAEREATRAQALLDAG